MTEILNARSSGDIQLNMSFDKKMREAVTKLVSDHFRGGFFMY